MAISMLKIRRPLGRLIFNMGIAIPGKTVFLIETAPCMCNCIICNLDLSLKMYNSYTISNILMFLLIILHVLNVIYMR